MRISMAQSDPQACRYSTNSVYRNGDRGTPTSHDDEKPSRSGSSGPAVPDEKELAKQLRVVELREKLRHAKEGAEALARELEDLLSELKRG